MTGRIVCFWGSPGSGKTVCALATAAKLAAKKKNVIVVNCDRSLPALKVYAPTLQTNAQQSLGALLMSGRFDDSSLSSRIVFHPESEYIGFLGLAPGDTYITYPRFEREGVIKLLNRLGAIADFILVDGSVYQLEDMLTLLSMELADQVVRLITPDNRGIVYLNANQPMFQDPKFRFEEHIKVLGNVKDISPVPETIRVVGNFDHILPYSHEVESKFIGGELISSMRRSSGIDFEEEISALAERLMTLA